MRKEREVHYLTKAQAVYSDLPQGVPIHNESPDFLFRIGSTVLGIEMTEFVRRLKNSSLTLRAVENLHAMVAHNAKVRFESKHGIPLWTGLHWDNRFKFSKKDVDTIASQLTALIETDIPPVAMTAHPSTGNRTVICASLTPFIA
jgi:hypothetical protein